MHGRKLKSNLDSDAVRAIRDEWRSWRTHDEMIALFEAANQDPSEPMVAWAAGDDYLRYDWALRRPDLFFVPPERDEARFYGLIMGIVFEKGDPKGLKKRIDPMVLRLRGAGFIDHWYDLARINIRVHFKRTHGNLAHGSGRDEMEGAAIRIGLRHLWSLLLLFCLGGILAGAVCATEIWRIFLTPGGACF